MTKTQNKHEALCQRNTHSLSFSKHFIPFRVMVELKLILTKNTYKTNILNVKIIVIISLQRITHTLLN